MNSFERLFGIVDSLFLALIIGVAGLTAIINF